MKKFAVIKVDGVVELHEVSAEAEGDFLSEAVGGWFQSVPLRGELKDYWLWCHEEGKIIGLAMNSVATALWILSYGPSDIIHGNVVITGGIDEEGDTLGLTNAQIAKLEEILELV
jgi:hypothetical protein